MAKYSKSRWVSGMLVAGILIAAALPVHAQRRDYLTGLEGDKIRDAESPSLRIKLFVGFAADRLRKFQYELVRPSADRRRGDRLTSLLNAYIGCIDDAAELIKLGIEKQEDIRQGLKEMQDKGKEFLATLESTASAGRDRELYKETLEDALESTKDALQIAQKGSKEMSPPPVRRKQ